MGRPTKEYSESLTDVELAVMQVLWNLEGGSVHEVLEVLEDSSGKEYAYTTVSTILRILEKKGFVFSEKQGRSHKYTATISENIYQTKSLNRLVEKVFSGQPTDLVKNLVATKKLSRQEIEELKKLIFAGE